MPSLEQKLDEFHPLFRTRVRALAERHPRLKDLAASFPALLFALAVPRGDIDHKRAIALVIEGARLRDVATAIELPMWLRKFRARAFSRVIPVLPDGELIARQIVNYAPKGKRLLSAWLTVVSEAYLWADADVAVWAARVFKVRPEKHRKRHARRVRAAWWLITRRRICLWAWYCRHVPNDPCATPATWSPSMNLKTATEAAGDWRRHVELRLRLGDEAIADPWGKPGHCGGFDIVPLTTFADVIEEGVAMRHCVRTYGGDLASGYSRLWSIRSHGVRVATFELYFSYEAPEPHIVQVKLKNDHRAPIGIWRVALGWLRAQTFSHLWARPEDDRPPVRLDVWRAMWRPYWLAKRHLPTWLPLRGHDDVLTNL